MLVVEAAADSREGTLLPLLVPLLDPEAGADRRRHLAEGLALLLVGRFGTYEPLVVPVPAVQGLVLGREAVVPGRRPDVLDHV